MRRQPLDFFVEVRNFPEKKGTYELYVKDLYNMWFNSLEDILRKANRPEFDDLLAALPREVKIRFVSNEVPADLKFVFIPPSEIFEQCGKGTLGCYKNTEGVIFVSEKLTHNPGEVNRVHLHEVGHSLGLADQYYLGRNNNANLNYASAIRDKSIMNAARGSKNVKGITEDDADGLIMAIDLALHNYDRGGEKGWKSLDKKSKQYYIHGRVANSPYSFHLDFRTNSISFAEYGKDWKSVQVKDLKFSKSGQDLFASLPKLEVKETDAQGRPVKEISPQGETVYTSYLYERQRKLFVDKKGLVTRYEENIWDRSPSDVALKIVRSGSADSLDVLIGYFRVLGEKPRVAYDRVAWQEEGDSYFYEAMCFKKTCEDRILRDPPDNVKRDSLQETIKQKALFERMRRWFKGKGKIKS